MGQSNGSGQADSDKSQDDLNEAQADLYTQQALQARYSMLVPDLTKVAAGTLDASNDKSGMASALSFTAMTHVAEKTSRSLRDKLKDLSAVRILLTSQPNLIQASSAGFDVASELDQLSKRADDLLEKAPQQATPSQAGQSQQRFVGITALGAVAAALPGVLSLFAKHESLATATMAPDDLAAVTAVAGTLLKEPKPQAVKLDTFQRAVRGPLYEQADALGIKVEQLRSLSSDSKEVKDLVTLIENTLTSILSVPKGGTLSPLAAANFWNLAFDGEAPMTHVLLVKSETGGTAELVDQRAVFADKVFLAATASISYMLIDVNSIVVASGVESATTQLYGNIHDVLKSSVID